jgi:hypothetical protein
MKRTDMKKQSTARPGRWLAATSLSLLTLTFNANTATAADATWTGYGDGVNWGDMLNWENVGHTGWQTGDPKLTSTFIKLNLGVDDTSTVNIDAQVAPWVGNGRTVTMSATNVLNIPAGGKLGNNDGTQMYNPAGGIINVTGGYFGMDLRPGSAPGGVCGTVNVSGGTYQAARITYVKSATVNIIGSAPTLVKVSDFFSWMNKSQPTLGFTLDAGGVTTFQFNTHGNDSNVDGNVPDPVTINVSGIATYAAGAKPMGDTFYLAKDTNSNLFHPNAWPNNVLVDGGLGRLDRVSNGVTLTILSTDPYATWAGAGVAFDADANNDGVDNGMAWVLGATDKDANATSLLPTLDNTNATYFIFTYNRKDDANTDPNTTIKVEYCSDLTGWTTAVHDNSNIIIAPTDNGAIDSVQVKIIRTLAVGNKLFARLNVQKAP